LTGTVHRDSEFNVIGWWLTRKRQLLDRYSW